MDVIECIRTRRSIRKYLDLPIPWHIVSEVLDAGRLAPSAGNLQNYKFIVAMKSGTRNALGDACFQQPWIATAPVIVTICADPAKSKRFYGARGERLFTTQNCAAVAQNMLLVAHAQGLGACWIGAFDEEKVKNALGLPLEIRPQVILAMGYPDEKVPPPAKLYLETFTYFEGWRGRLQDANVYFGWHSVTLERNLKSGIEHTKKAVETIKEKAKQLTEDVKKKF